jgi:hypothetical protein
MAGEHDPTTEPALDIDIGLQAIRVPARNILRSLEALAKGNPKLISTTAGIREFIQSTPEYNAAGIAVIELVTEKRAQGMLIGDGLGDTVLAASLLKVEANVLQDIWGHAFYHILRPTMFDSARVIDPNTIRVSGVIYDTLEREADSVGNLFRAEVWYLEELLKFDKNWQDDFSRQILWPPMVVKAAFQAQEDIQSTKEHRTFGLSQAGLLSTGYANALLMYVSVFRSLFPILVQQKEMTEKQAAALEQHYIHHFSKQAGANISSVMPNRRNSMGTDHIFRPDLEIVDDLAHEATTRCVAFIDRLLIETYYDFRNYIQNKHYQNTNVHKLLLPLSTSFEPESKASQ